MKEKTIERNQSLAVTRLYDAAHAGDVRSLLELLEEDPHLLNRCIIENIGRFARSPLHIAANLGHFEFTKEILSRKPELAEELDQSNRWSPLHFASAKGYLEVVQTLIKVNPNMCFVRDQNGRNPVHTAALNGQIDVLDELLQAKPLAAMERTNDGDTVLHLCVKHSQPEALMKFADAIDDGDELLNSKDGDGNTVLHLAVAAKQLELVNFLLKNGRMKTTAINKNGSTAMDICIKSRDNEIRREIRQALNLAKKLPAEAEDRAKLEDHRSGLMVVASLIATMAFEVGVNPPGGVWQDNKPDTSASPGPSAPSATTDESHYAGVSIMSDKATSLYISLMTMSSLAVVASLSVILLLISGLPHNRIFVRVLRTTMWIAITAITLTYATCIAFLSTEGDTAQMIRGLIISFWTLLVFMLLLIHAGRYFIEKPVKKLYYKYFEKPLKKLYYKYFSWPATANQHASV